MSAVRKSSGTNYRKYVIRMITRYPDGKEISSYFMRLTNMVEFTGKKTEALTFTTKAEAYDTIRFIKGMVGANKARRFEIEELTSNA